LKAASALLSGDHRTVGGERKLSLGKVLVLVIVLIIATVGDVDAAVPSKPKRLCAPLLCISLLHQKKLCARTAKGAGSQGLTQTYD
jgi:hypothetical protein